MGSPLLSWGGNIFPCIRQVFPSTDNTYVGRGEGKQKNCRSAISDNDYVIHLYNVEVEALLQHIFP